MNQYLTPKLYANIYVLFASIVVLTLLFTYRPFNSMHEGQHFMRGLTFSTLYKQETLPKSIFEFHALARDRSSRDYSSDSKKLFTEQLLPIPPAAVHIKLNQQERKIYKSNPNVSVYLFIDYLPQIISGTLGDVFNLKPFTIYYITRLMMLLSAVVAGYVILRMLPSFHVPVIIMLLLPTWWLTRTSQYVDQTVNLAVLVYFTLLVRSLYKAERVKWRCILGFLLSGMILSAAKTVYFPITFSILLLPKHKFDSRKYYIVSMCLIIGLSTLASVFSAVYATRAYHNISFTQLTQSAMILMQPKEVQKFKAEAKAENKKWRKKNEKWINPENAHLYMFGNRSAMQNSLEHPINTVKLVFRKILLKVGFWKNTIKRIFFWKSGPEVPVIRVLGLLPYILALFPFFFCVSNTVNCAYISSNIAGYETRKRDNLLLGLILISTSVLIAISMHVTNIGLRGVQGRYFIPLLPVVGLLCSVYLTNQWSSRVIVFQAIAGISVLLLFYLALFRVV